MSEKVDRVKSELAFYGIRILDGGNCLSFMEGHEKPVQSSCKEKISHLKYESEQDKEGVLMLWGRVLELLGSAQQGVAGGSPATEKMFAAALKHLLKFSRMYKYFRKHAKVFSRALRSDVKRFSSATMASVIDHKICIEWLDHLVRRNVYCCKLLAFLEATKAEQNIVTSQQLTPSGTFDMEGDEADPLKERRWEWDDDEFEEDLRPQNLESVVGTDPEWLSEGFEWGDYTGPFLYGDEENDPYGNKHHYNFKSKIHRNMDS